MDINQLVHNIECGVAANRSTYSDELYTDYKYVRSQDKCCHNLTVALIKNAASLLPGIYPASTEKVLTLGWRPDVRLLDHKEQPVCVVEYESLNSSDARVVEKDVYGYESWIKGLLRPVPLLIITTLVNRPAPAYKLLHVGEARYNRGHASKIVEIRKNPFLYWYSFFRRWLEHRIVGLPVHFANFNGSQLELIKLWPTEPTPYTPMFADGADWSGKWPASRQTCEVRTAYKTRLWGESNVEKLREIVLEYWAKEQASCVPSGWDSNAEKAFLRDAKRVQNREEACRRIESVQ